MKGPLLTAQWPVSKVVYFDRFRERTCAPEACTASAIRLTERRSAPPNSTGDPAWLTAEEDRRTPPSMPTHNDVPCEHCGAQAALSAEISPLGSEPGQRVYQCP